VQIKGFNRVELIVRPDQIEAARAQFNGLLGLKLPPPHQVSRGRALSSTDFDGFIELVAPVDPEMAMSVTLAEHGPGQVGPLVWEVEDLDAARDWLQERNLRVAYEYDSRAGNAAEKAAGVRQLILDKDQWFGFTVTLMERSGS
jgi:Glyoxalase/Bleomycin resistance protein/Dioxygenase superfamily